MDYYKVLSQYFFIDYVGIAITIIVFIIGLKHYKEPKNLRIITYYLGTTVGYSLTGTYFQLFENNLIVGIIGESIFSVTEFIIFCIYLYKLISSSAMRTIMKFFYWTFPALLMFGWIKWKRYDIPGIAYVLDALYLIGPCLVYLYELFNTSKIISLKNSPPFWIVTGILFYNCCSLPVFLLKDFFIIKSSTYLHMTFSINYMLYNILYLLFLKAYLCKKKSHPYRHEL